MEKLISKVPKRKLDTGEEILQLVWYSVSIKYGPEAISEAVYGAIKFVIGPHRLRRRLSERGPDRSGC